MPSTLTRLSKKAFPAFLPWWRTTGVAVVAAALVVYTVLSFNVSALPNPGWLETSLATSAKHWYVARAARAKLPTAPPDNGQNVASGQALFGMACASCHGQDARTPTPMGQSMYPRA